MIKVLLSLILSTLLGMGITSCSFFGSSSEKASEEITQTEADADFGEDDDYDPLTDEDEDVASIDKESDEKLFDDGETADFESEEGFGGDDEFEGEAIASNNDEEISDDELLDESDPLETANNASDEVSFDDELNDEGATSTIAEDEFTSESADDVIAENSTDIDNAPALDEPSESSTDISYDSDSMYDNEPKKLVSVKKVKSEPFNKNGILANAIYIVRQGDTLGSISNKIYGEKRLSDLLKVNTTLGNGVKVGDKVYYNSPQRPNDNSSLLTYYEDLNLSPQNYTMQPGDNIRTVSKKLLGHSSSWKEVWATNPDVVSKWTVNDSVNLRYWSDGGPELGQQLAQNDPPPPIESFNPPPDQAFNPPPPPQEDFNNNPPPPPVEEKFNPPPIPAQAKVPPPPPVEEKFDDLPPPPPPIEAVAPPPPPSVAKIAPPPPPKKVAKAPPPPPSPRKATKKRNKKRGKNLKKGLASAADKDKKMLMGASAIGLLAMVLLFIIWRKKRSRRAIDFNTSTTQIE